MRQNEMGRWVNFYDISYGDSHACCYISVQGFLFLTNIFLFNFDGKWIKMKGHSSKQYKHVYSDVEAYPLLYLYI